MCTKLQHRLTTDQLLNMRLAESMAGALESQRARDEEAGLEDTTNLEDQARVWRTIASEYSKGPDCNATEVRRWRAEAMALKRTANSR